MSSRLAVDRDHTADRDRAGAPAGTPRRVRRLSPTHRVGGVAAGQVIIWQLAVLLVVLAFAAGWADPPRYAAVGLAATAVALTAGRGRGGWWYQQAGRWLRYRLAAAEVAGPPRVLGGEPGQAAVAWDGGAWVAVLAVRADAPLLDLGDRARALPFEALAGLLGDGVSGVRLVVRRYGPGLGRAWLALRGPAGLPPAPGDVPALVRRRADRAATLLAGHGLRAVPLDGTQLPAVLTGSATAGRVRWGAWERDSVAEVCYRLAAPRGADRLDALADRLADVPADAVTVAVGLSDATGGERAGEIGVRVDVRLSLAPGTGQRPARAALERAARPWRPVLRAGEHALALPDTLPVGGRTDPADGPGYAVPVAGGGWLDAPLPAGGLLAGYTSGGQPARINLFGPGRPRRIGVLADVATARLLAARAARAGAAVVVRTGRPGAWREPSGDTDPPTVLGPDDPVAAHPVRPVVLIEDSPQDAAPAGAAAPYPVIEVLPALTARTVRALRGYDLLVLRRTTQIDALRTGYDVPSQEGRWLARLPEDVLALAVPGRVSYVRTGQPHSDRT